MASGWKRTWVGVGAVSLVATVLGAGYLAMQHEPRPRGTAGANADAMARRIRQAVRIDAWQKTGAVRWNFGGRHDLLWDRTRQLVEVRWEGHRILRRTSPGGLARVWVRDHEIHGDAARTVADKAYAVFCNDAYWLNPFEGLFDAGVVRETATVDGELGLVVRYGRGGVTPGDAYLWLLDRDGLPTAYRMWVSLIPLGGVRASWERWVTLDTGARVATSHDMALRVLELTDVVGKASLEELAPEADPFAALVADSEPTTQPN